MASDPKRMPRSLLTYGCEDGSARGGPPNSALGGGGVGGRVVGNRKRSGRDCNRKCGWGGSSGGRDPAAVSLVADGRLDHRRGALRRPCQRAPPAAWTCRGAGGA